MVRVAIVTESFVPLVNGVANSVRHVVDRLEETGHSTVVIAPGPGPSRYGRVPVVRVRSVPLPGYRSFPLGLPDSALQDTLAAFAPDVVHLASPVMLDALGLRSARRLGIPTVAVFQTDLEGFARQYRIRAGAPLRAWLRRLHTLADRTLAPSSSSERQLRAAGVPQVYRWGRGVDLDLFQPSRRCPDLHRRLAPHGQVLIGYVGRVSADKQVRRLVELASLPDSRLVVVGSGPERMALQQRIPHAAFLGLLQGSALARAFATLDVFVHTGAHETFCQTVQEAQASRVAAVAPAAGGPVDLIEHGMTGLLFDPAAAGAFRQTVSNLVFDPRLRARLAHRGHAGVRGRSWGSVVDSLVAEHYAAVVASPRRPPVAA